MDAGSSVALQQASAIEPYDPFAEPASAGEGFLRLPLEIREEIYDWALKSDETVFKQKKSQQFKRRQNTRNVFLLCKRTYNEASKVLARHPTSVIVGFEGGPIFRHPRASGKCYNIKLSQRPPHVPGFSELEFIRLRNITLDVMVPFAAPRSSRLQVEMVTLKDKLGDLAKALGKSEHIEKIRIIMHRDRTTADFNGEGDRCGIRPPLVSLLSTATRMGISVILESRGGSMDDWADPTPEPLIQWLLQVAEQEGLKFEEADAWPKKLPEATEEYLSDAVTEAKEDDKKVAKKDDSENQKKQSKKVENNAPERFPGYMLASECRSCLALFATRCDLLGHLDENPTHRGPFRQKGYNPLIVPKHLRSTRRKCHYCAQSFNDWRREKTRCAVTRLQCSEYPLLPRWKEDNEEWLQQCKLFGETGDERFVSGHVA